MISDGFVAALVFVALLAALLAAVNILTWGRPTHEYHMLTASAALRRWVNLIGAILLLLFVIGLYPYEREHHWYEPYTATIVAKDAATFNVNEDNKYRIELDNGVIFRSDDYRFVPLQVGDVVRVNCIRNWHYTAQDDWDCQFAGTQP